MNRDMRESAPSIRERPQVDSRRTDPVVRAPVTLEPSPYAVAAPAVFPLFVFGRTPLGAFGTSGCTNFINASPFVNPISANPFAPVDCLHPSYQNGANSLTPLVPGRDPNALYGPGYTPNFNILQ